MDVRAWLESQGLAIPFGNRAAVFKDGGHVATAKEFVRFLVGEGWLAHYLDFAGERMLPPMPALLDSPFWLDPRDPHRMRSAMQLLIQPRSYSYVAASGDGGTMICCRCPKRVGILGRRPSIASPPTASPPSRRSTRRSRGSSRF